MIKPPTANTPRTTGPQTAEPSGLRFLVLASVFFLLGVVLTGIWFKHRNHAAGSFLPGQELSSQTVDVLRHLNTPVEIRFYSLLSPSSAPESLQDFSGRVDHLLSEFQDANGSQIHVVRNISTSGANADAAATDGIQPFNLEKGDACFLGVTVVSGERKESLSRLQPEWEPALEFDLARAVLHVTATPATSVVKPSTPVSPEVTNEIVRLIPDINGASLEGGTRILREAAVNKMNEAGAEMEKQIQAAQQQLADVQSGGSEAEQQAAMKHLQQVQLDQAEKNKHIAAQLQVELDVFQQMKAAASAAK